MSDSLRWTLCSYTLALALGLSALGAGGVHLSLLGISAALIAASGLLAAPELDSEARARGWRERVGIGAGLLLTLYCSLQALPLPVGWLEALAPRNADVWVRSFRLLEGPPPALATLSLAPGRTLIEALKAASHTVVFSVSFALSAKLGMHRMAALAFGLAVLVALVSAGHQLVGAERLYGIYEPIDAYSIAPLLNANNLAGYLNLGFFCGLGLLFRAGTRPYGALIGIGLVFVAAEVLLCESVGGTGTLLLGLLAVLLLPRGNASSRHPFELGRLIQAGIVLLLGCFAALMALAARRTPLGLDDRSVEKLDLFARASKVIADHPWFGVGRGAFGSVFASYQGHGSHVISEHVENFPLQWAAEWGIPVALLALLTLCVLLSSQLRRKALSSPTRRCALVGCGVLLSQNMVDLGLEIPALGALFWFVVGALCAGQRDTDSAPASTGRALSWAAPGACLACLVLALAWGTESPARLRHELRASLTATAEKPTEDFWSQLEGAIRAYPGEWYFPLLGSSAALGAGRNPLPWISRALERNPLSAEAHVQLARVLMAHRRKSQALGALRRALELEPKRAHAVMTLARGWGLGPSEIETAAPEGAAGAPLYQVLAAVTAGSERQRMLEESLARDDNQADVHYQLASHLLRDLSGELPGGNCASQREACLERATRHAARGHQPDSARAGVLEARLLLAKGQPREAEAHLVTICEQLSRDVACLENLFRVALANRSPRLDDVVQSYVAAACRTRESCGNAHLQLGRQFAGSNEWGLALGHFRRATEEDPTPPALNALIHAAERLGQGELARDTRRRLQLLQASEARGTGSP